MEMLIMLLTAKRIATTIVLIVILLFSLVGCGDTGIPDGLYEPVDERLKSSMSIEIDGNNFTQVAMITTTLKFEYNEGTISFITTDGTVSLPAEYNEDSGILTYMGIEFKLTEN
jgi:predicted small lipoprotein YifL